MPGPSIVEAIAFPEFKAAAAEGAVLELRMRLLAAKIPALKKHAHENRLQDIEGGLIKYFGAELSNDEKKALCLCRQLRNKLLHSDFRAARGKLCELGIAPSPGGVVKLDLPEASVEAVASKIEAARDSKEGVLIASTRSTDEGGVLGWLLEAKQSGDFAKATDAFKSAGEIISRLATIEGT
jgi:hypothetical protein